MPKLIGMAAIAVCLGFAAQASTPDDIAKPAAPVAVQQPNQPAPLRVAPFTKSNSKRGCAPAETPLQVRPAQTQCL